MPGAGPKSRVPHNPARSGLMIVFTLFLARWLFEHVFGVWLQRHFHPVAHIRRRIEQTENDVLELLASLRLNFQLLARSGGDEFRVLDHRRKRRAQCGDSVGWDAWGRRERP